MSPDQRIVRVRFACSERDHGVSYNALEYGLGAKGSGLLDVDFCNCNCNCGGCIGRVRSRWLRLYQILTGWKSLLGLDKQALSKVEA